MYQLTQQLKSGHMEILEVPLPSLNEGQLLVRNHYSVISAGTEGKTVKDARASYLAKAKSRQKEVAAGMVFQDLEKLVQQEGLSGALEELFKQGVYLTVDEFKGRTEVVRGSFCMQVHPNQLRNPRSRFHVPALSGGSGGNATPVLLDLDYLREQAVNTLLKNLRLQNSVWRHAQWLVPGGLGIALALEYSLAGLAPLVGEMAGVERRPISFEKDGMKYRVTAGELIDQSLEGVPSVSKEGEPLYVDNTAHPVASRLALAKATNSSFHAFGVDWDDASGTRNGHFAAFSWSG